MSDKQLASAVRLGRRQGFSRAVAAAFFGLVLAAPVVAFTDDPLAAVIGMASGVIVALGIGAVVSGTRG